MIQKDQFYLKAHSYTILYQLYVRIKLKILIYIYI